MRRTLCLLALLSVLAAVAVAVAVAAPPGSVNQRGDGWPRISGMLLINSQNTGRPLDARPGNDPFGGLDKRYRCDGKKRGGRCKRFLERCEGRKGLCVKDVHVHNELLGGHGNDTIHGGPMGDLLWADFRPGGPKRQRDRITGGEGRDFIYGGPGRNVIKAGDGNDFVKSRYGRGIIDCGPGTDTLYTSRRYRHRYKITGCERQSTRASPGQGGSPNR